MTYTQILELVVSVSQLVAGGAVIYGVFVARKQLTAWHTETMIKKKAEAAENLYSISLEVSDTLKSLRSSRGIGNLTPQDCRQEPYFQMLSRLNDASGVFLSLRRAQVRVMALIGDAEVEQAVDTLFDVRFKVAQALQIFATDKRSINGNVGNRTSDFYAVRETRIFGTYGEDDLLGKSQIEAIECLKSKLLPFVRMNQKA